jgi:hypothetical protein
MGMGTRYHNNYLKPGPYNLQQIIYMTVIIQWNVPVYIKIYKQTSKNGESIKQRSMVLISKRKKCLQKLNKGEKKELSDLHD